jgi:hypothetical protein
MYQEKTDMNVVVTNGLYFLFDDRICNRVNNTNIHITFGQTTINKYKCKDTCLPSQSRIVYCV